mgnify:CR=1 FL=1
MAKTSEEIKAILEQFTIPFFHLEKRFPLLPGKADKKAEAILLGISEEELSSFRENINQNAKQGALELLKEDEIIEIDPNKKTKYLNVNISGTFDEYKIKMKKAKK